MMPIGGGDCRGGSYPEYILFQRSEQSTRGIVVSSNLSGKVGVGVH